jgi:hypothetical protein
MLLAEMRRGVVVLVLALGCAPSSPEKPPPASASSATPQQAPIPPDLVDPIARSAAIGRQLYVLNTAAQLGSDALLANVPDAANKGLAAPIPVQENDEEGRPKESFLVTFLTTDDPPRIAYEVRLAPNTKLAFLPYTPPKEASPALVGIARARQVAISTMPPSDQPIIAIVLPGEAKGGTDVFVYLLAGTTKPNVAVFGKHYRALVPIGGTSATYVMPINNLAIEVPTKGPNGEPVEALVVNHAATEYPVETHVFMSLVHKLPVYVGTRRGNFRVDGDKISFAGDKGPTKID